MFHCVEKHINHMAMNGSTKKDDRLHFCSSNFPLFQHLMPFQTTAHGSKLKAADSVSHYFSEVIHLNEKKKKIQKLPLCSNCRLPICEVIIALINNSAKKH